MLDLSRTSMGIAAGLAGTLFLGYCIYFDQKRRKDPDFKKKLRERRKLARQSTSSGRHDPSALPNPKDHQAVQEYFLQQIQLGEELLVTGNLDEGIEHFGRAIAFCGQPNKLLEVLQQSMPAPVFRLLVQRLPLIMQNCAPVRAASMQDDDLE